MSESFKNLYKAQTMFTDFSQRLTSAVNTIVSGLKVRQTLIETMTFENATSEFKGNQ